MLQLLRKELSRIGHCPNLVRLLSTNEVSRKTSLYDFHVEQKAKMVDFAGFQMPLIYADQSVSSSHNHTRKHVSIFDVSHMLQTTISGKHRIEFIESLIVSDIQGLKENQGTLTVFTNEKGGIIDDLIVTKTDGGFLYLVSNAGCMKKDLEHLQKNLEDFNKKKNADVNIRILEEQALIAVQGPGTAKVIKPFVECNLEDLTFMTSTLTTLCGIQNCRITRCGYTGEDGVEISLPSDKVRYIVENLLTSTHDNVKLAGLASRDTLRLEAGLCLYGNDITENNTPVEAGLSFTIGKRRKNTADFPGANEILRQLKEKAEHKRVGFVNQGPPARAHIQILNESGTSIGVVTSGSPSPYLHKNISMGYVPMQFSKPGTKVKFIIRKKLVEAEVVKLPFVPTHYYYKKS